MRSLTIHKILGLVILCAACPAYAQNSPPPPPKENWDFSVWVAAETGEELTNSFSESQIWSAGIFVGRMITGERLNSWRRGRLEYAADFMPVFETYGNQHVHGYGFEPVIFRWNSAMHTARISPYIELAGGGVSTNANLPPGNTSSFNFTAKGGGGIYLRTRPRQSFDVGLHWSHISNANLGVDNFEFNGVQLSLAYHWLK
jgi:lipid A 3-O-deacylase PagL